MDPNITPAGAGDAAAQGAAVSIDWTAIDPTTIPEAVLKAHPLYEAVLRESIERRRTIAELKAKLPAEKQEAQAKPETPAANDPLAALSAKLDGVLTVIETMQNQQLEALRAGQRLAAVKAANLPEGAAAFVQGETPEEMQESAKSLAALMPVVPANGGIGNAGAQGEGAFKRQLRERLAGQKSPDNIFSVGVQTTKGGGIFSK